MFGGPVLSPYAQAVVVEKLNEAGLGTFKIDRLTIRKIWPPQVHVKSVQVQFAGDTIPLGLSVVIEAVDITLSPKSYFPTTLNEWNVQVSVSKPTFHLLLPQDIQGNKNTVAKQVSSKSTHKDTQSFLPTQWIVNLILKIFDATIIVSDSQGEVAKIDNFSFELSGMNVLNDKLTKKVALSAAIDLPRYKFKTNLKADSENLLVSPDTLGSEKINLSISGLQSVLSGSSILNTETHNWKATISLPDLATLSVPPEFLPPGKWSGGISGLVTFQKTAAGQLATVALATQQLTGAINMVDQKFKAHGLISPKVSLKAKYTDQLTIEDVNIDADLTNLSLQIPDLLFKPEKTPLLLKLNGQGTESELQLKQAQLQFDQVLITAEGTVGIAAGKRSQLNVRLPAVQLSGLERKLLPLKDFPLSGQMGLDAKVVGDLFNFSDATIDFTKINVKDVRGGINFTSQDKSLAIKGPFLANVIGSAQIRKLNLSSANVQGNVDLSGLSLSQKDVFEKKAQETLALQFDMQQVKDSTQIKSLSFHSDFARLKVSGRIANPQRPYLDIKAQIQNINLGRISQKVASFKTFGLLGQVNGDIGIKGTFDANGGIEKSPLAVTGKLNVQIPKYVFLSAPPQIQKEANAKETEVELPDATALLPNWPVLRDSQITMNVTLGQFEFDKIKAEKIQVQANYNRGQVQGSATVGQLFRGIASVPNFSTTTLFKPPTFSGAMSAKNISANEALSFVAPQYAGHLTGGLLNGDYKFSTQRPQTKNWLPKLVASGQLSGENIKTKEDIIQKALGDKLSQFAKDKKALSDTPKPINANLNMNFNLKNSVAEIKSLNLLTDDNNEFTGAGKVDLNLMADLKGTLYLSKVDIGGSVRAANSDAKGRFVVPLAVKGSLLEPSFDIAAHTLQEIGKRTLKYEAKQATEKLKDDFKQHGKDELKKKLKGLFK